MSKRVFSGMAIGLDGMLQNDGFRETGANVAELYFANAASTTDDRLALVSLALDMKSMPWLSTLTQKDLYLRGLEREYETLLLRFKDAFGNDEEDKTH